MSNINVTIRMGEDLKKRADELFNDIGMSFSTALKIFIRQAVRVCRIPFEIRGEIPNGETKAATEEIKRMKADPSIRKSYAAVEEMMEYLLT